MCGGEHSRAAGLQMNEWNLMLRQWEIHFNLVILLSPLCVWTQQHSKITTYNSWAAAVWTATLSRRARLTAWCIKCLRKNWICQTTTNLHRQSTKNYLLLLLQNNMTKDGHRISRIRVCCKQKMSYSKIGSSFLMHSYTFNLHRENGMHGKTISFEHIAVGEKINDFTNCTKIPHVLLLTGIGYATCNVCDPISWNAQVPPHQYCEINQLHSSHRAFQIKNITFFNGVFKQIWISLGTSTLSALHKHSIDRKNNIVHDVVI